MSLLARTTGLARTTRLAPTLPRSFSLTSRRCESPADGPNTGDHVQRASPAKSFTSPVFLGVGALFAFVCGYYILHSDKSPGSGQARVKELRRERADPGNEYRDPRDSGVKTLEQKKAKEEGKLR